MEKYTLVAIISNTAIIFFFFSLVCLIFIYLIYTKKISNLTGYDAAKEILDNNKITNVDIIETKSQQSTYNLQRKTIKLSTRVYYGKDYFSLALAYILSSYATIANQEKNNFSKLKGIITNVNVFSISAILSILVGTLFIGAYAKIGLIFLGIIFIYQIIRKLIYEEILLITKNIELQYFKAIKIIILLCKSSIIISIFEITKLFIYIIK